jgi:hypothetical protein
MLDSPVALGALIVGVAVLLFLSGWRFADEELDLNKAHNWLLRQFNCSIRAFEKILRQKRREKQGLRVSFFIWRMILCADIIYFIIRFVIYNEFKTQGALIQLLSCSAALAILFFFGLIALRVIKKAEEDVLKHVKRLLDTDPEKAIPFVGGCIRCVDPYLSAPMHRPEAGAIIHAYHLILRAYVEQAPQVVVWENRFLYCAEPYIEARKFLTETARRLPCETSKANYITPCTCENRDRKKTPCSSILPDVCEQKRRARALPNTLFALTMAHCCGMDMGEAALSALLNVLLNKEQGLEDDASALLLWLFTPLILPNTRIHSAANRFICNESEKNLSFPSLKVDASQFFAAADGWLNGRTFSRSWAVDCLCDIYRDEIDRLRGAEPPQKWYLKKQHAQWVADARLPEKLLNLVMEV